MATVGASDTSTVLGMLCHGAKEKSQEKMEGRQIEPEEAAQDALSVVRNIFATEKPSLAARERRDREQGEQDRPKSPELLLRGRKGGGG